MKLFLTTALVAGLAAPALLAAEATADVKDRDGKSLGAVLVQDTASGVALATLTLNNLPEGVYAVHLPCSYPQVLCGKLIHPPDLALRDKSRP